MILLKINPEFYKFAKKKDYAGYFNVLWDYYKDVLF